MGLLLYSMLTLQAFITLFKGGEISDTYLNMQTIQP